MYLWSDTQTKWCVPVIWIVASALYSAYWQYGSSTICTCELSWGFNHLLHELFCGFAIIGTYFTNLLVYFITYFVNFLVFLSLTSWTFFSLFMTYFINFLAGYSYYPLHELSCSFQYPLHKLSCGFYYLLHKTSYGIL